MLFRTRIRAVKLTSGRLRNVRVYFGHNILSTTYVRTCTRVFVTRARVHTMFKETLASSFTLHQSIYHKQQNINTNVYDLFPGVRI